MELLDRSHGCYTVKVLRVGLVRSGLVFYGVGNRRIVLHVVLLDVLVRMFVCGRKP